MISDIAVFHPDQIFRSMAAVRTHRLNLVVFWLDKQQRVYRGSYQHLRPDQWSSNSLFLLWFKVLLGTLVEKLLLDSLVSVLSSPSSVGGVCVSAGWAWLTYFPLPIKTLLHLCCTACITRDIICRIKDRLSCPFSTSLLPSHLLLDLSLNPTRNPERNHMKKLEHRWRGAKTKEHVEQNGGNKQTRLKQTHRAQGAAVKTRDKRIGEETLIETDQTGQRWGGLFKAAFIHLQIVLVLYVVADAIVLECPGVWRLLFLKQYPVNLGLLIVRLCSYDAIFLWGWGLPPIEGGNHPTANVPHFQCFL